MRQGPGIPQWFDGRVTGFAMEMERQTLPPLLDLALNLRNRVMGRAKAMLAFQFMVLPVQDTSNSCFFYSRYQKYFL